jgi:hypothetical protein
MYLEVKKRSLNISQEIEIEEVDPKIIDFRKVRDMLVF